MSGLIELAEVESKFGDNEKIDDQRKKTVDGNSEAQQDETEGRILRRTLTSRLP